MNEPQYKTIDKFDRMLGSLSERPDVTETKPSTIVDHSQVIGAAQTFIIQTKRERDKGDYIFLQYVDDVTSVRIFLPPAVADAIARQRDDGQGPQARRQGAGPGPEGARRATGIHEGQEEEGEEPAEGSRRGTQQLTPAGRSPLARGSPYPKGSRMQALERRQARRIKRHAKEAESSLFELIELMTDDDVPADEPLDWEQAIRLIESVRIEMKLVFDLAASAQREVA